jgi:micrococcal nuclease
MLAAILMALALGYRIPTEPIVLDEPVAVVDGDTIDVGAERIRIANLDAPETGRARCARERELGEAATAAAAELIGGAREIVIHPERRRDRNSRVLARVELDGRDFAELMIARGLGRPWRGRGSNWCAETR